MTRPVAALIACVKTKQSKPCKAIELYTSPLFRKSCNYAQSLGLPIYILSAKYGLISGTRIIAPYEQTLNTMKSAEIDQWAQSVAIEIQKTFNSNPLMVLAGEKYLSFRQYTDNPLILPFGKLSLGQRLQWLNSKI